VTAPRIVLLLGMHRSGTSIATRALAALGIDLGENLMRAAARKYPEGLLEDTAFVRINNALLTSFGLKWHSLEEIAPESWTQPGLRPFRQQARRLLESRVALYRPFGFKDPRTCRLLPFWRSVVNEITGDVGCVIVARNPMAVAQSLHRRDKFALEHALELWHLHMKALVGPIDGAWKKVTVEYDQLLEDPERQLQRISGALSLGTPSPQAVADVCGTFLDPTLRHNAPAGVEGWPAHVVETWNELRRLSLLDSAPPGASLVKPIVHQSRVQDRASFASSSTAKAPQQSMNNGMTAVQANTQEVDAWSRIAFSGFHLSVVNRFRERYAQIGIQTEPLRIARIANGLVRSLRSGETDRTARHVGVTDGNNRDVEESVRVRDVPSTEPQALPHAAQTETAHEDRPAYYLGAEPRPYGHVLLEMISRAWAWEKHGENRLAVLQCRPVPEYVLALLGLIPGLSERLEIVQRPTRFREILVPAPAFVIRRHAHVEMRLLAERMAARALSGRLSKTDQPLYLSRSRLGPRARRIFVGEEQFESFLEGQGFRVLAPETLPIKEQIALFNRHKWIVSPQGSACHSRLFALEPINLIVLTNELNPNFILCDMLSRGTAHYANVFEATDYLRQVGIKRQLHSSQPVMLRHAACLDVLKKLGLVNAKARFPRREDREETYRRIWLANAHRHSIRNKDGDMLDALIKLGYQPES
jgi:capsular polysaccharide biosynthesis protein